MSSDKKIQQLPSECTIGIEAVDAQVVLSEVEGTTKQKWMTAQIPDKMDQRRLTNIIMEKEKMLYK